MAFRFIILIIYHCESSAECRMSIRSPSTIYTRNFSFARFRLLFFTFFRIIIKIIIIINDWMHHVWFHLRISYMYNLHVDRWCRKRTLARNPRRLGTPFNNFKRLILIGFELLKRKQFLLFSFFFCEQCDFFTSTMKYSLCVCVWATVELHISYFKFVLIYALRSFVDHQFIVE